MDDRLQVMLNRYDCHSRQDYENALKQIMQQIALLGLWRAKFFEHAAFYGGTALRILYALDRFSEDLDFSLLKPNPNFVLDIYNEAIQAELMSFGLDVTVENKIKSPLDNIKSAFIKAGTKNQLLVIDVPDNIIKSIHHQQTIKIKMEVDVDPPGQFEIEAKVLLDPIPFAVATYKTPDLFAGKLHAILCRQWKNRVKGRDWYDLIWYVKNKIPVRLEHLRQRLLQTKALTEHDKFNRDVLLAMLFKKTDEVDFENAKIDILLFIDDASSITLWSKKFFKEIIDLIVVM